MDRQQQQIPQGDTELPPIGPAPPQQGRLELFREHHRQAMERHRHTVSYRVPLEMQRGQQLQQRFLQPGGAAQKGPPASGGRGGAADKPQGGGGVEVEGSEHGARLAEEGMVTKGTDLPKEVEDVIRQVQTQAQAQAMPPSSRAKAPPLPSGGTAGCTPVGTDGTKPAVPVDPTHTLPVVSSAHSGSPSPNSAPGGPGNGRSRPQQPAAQLAYQRVGGAKGGSTPSSQDDELNLDAHDFMRQKFNLFKGDGTTPNPTPPPSTTVVPQSSPGTKMAAAGQKPPSVPAMSDTLSAQPKQPGYPHPLGPAPPTSAYAGTTPSLYPSDPHPPPPAPSDAPHSQASYDELSEADMMWNKYANPKQQQQQQQQQQPTATLTSQTGHAHQHPSPMTGQVYMAPPADALSHTGYPPPHQHTNSGGAQTPTGGPGSIPGGHEPHPQGVVTSPTSYPTQQYHAPPPSAGVNPHQQYYVHDVRRQPGSVHMAGMQPQQAVQMYQTRRVGEGHPAHQQYLAAAAAQQHPHVAAVAASQYQREQMAVAAAQQQRQGWDSQWAQQHPQHPQQQLQQHAQQQENQQRMALFQQHMNMYSSPAQQGMGVQSVPMPSSFHGVLKQGPPNVVMTQSTPLNYNQPTHTMPQQQTERVYAAAQGHTPQVQMMAQPHETVYQHPGMGQQVQTGGQHAYQTVDGRTHMMQADQQQQLYAHPQQSSYGGHFGAGSHPSAVLYTAGVKRGVTSSDLAAYEVATKQMVMTHPQGMMQQAPVQRMVQQPVGMVQHTGMMQHAAGVAQQAQYFAPH